MIAIRQDFLKSLSVQDLAEEFSKRILAGKLEGAGLKGLRVHCGVLSFLLQPDDMKMFC
jgi:hypothetical protein